MIAFLVRYRDLAALVSLVAGLVIAALTGMPR